MGADRHKGVSDRYHSHRISDLNLGHQGDRLKLAGRITHVRDHGGVVFIHLLDGVSTLQIRFNPDTFAEPDLRREMWVSVEGKLEPRPEGTDNVLSSTIVLPAHELVARSVEVHTRPSVSLEELPSLDLPVNPRMQDFRDDDDKETRQAPRLTVSEEQLLKHRAYALRRNDLQRALHVRSRVALQVRHFLASQGFSEIETPILAAPAPEGARDFLVPSRLHMGCAYALPQSPQIYKQLLMIGGFRRYFQISRCFRDEDLRANRQPEFTQIDLEMSFVTEEDVIDLVTRMLQDSLETVRGMTATLDRPYEFSLLTYDEAMSSYGTDAPDLRIPYKIVDLSAVFAGTSFDVFRKFIDHGGPVLGIPVSAAGQLGRQEINRIREWAKREKLPQPAWGDCKDGRFVSTIDKYLDDAEKSNLASHMQEGGQIFFVAAFTMEEARQIAGKLRVALGTRSSHPELDKLEFVWVTGFPAFEKNAAGELLALHHPFTDLDLPEEVAGDSDDLLALSSRAYDLVLNGEELGSGSLRIHDLRKQLRVLGYLGYDEKRARGSFPHLIAGLEYGAPPHGGIALGFDRLISKLLDVPSIRQVIAFPKDGWGRCLITHSPKEMDADELRQLGLRHSEYT